MSWFHSYISSKKAISLLMQNGVDGSFLVRHSEHNSKNYTLAVRRGGNVHHVTIRNEGDFFYVGDASHQFSTLAALIEHLRRIPITDEEGEPINLIEPLNNEVPTKEKWYHKGISGPEAEHMLQQRAKDGNFLVRHSVHSPGSMVLSVLQNGKVHHFPIISQSASNTFQMKGSPLQFDSLSKLVEHFQCTEIKLISGAILKLTKGLHSTRFEIIDVTKRMNELGGLTFENEDNAPKGYKMEYDELQTVELQMCESDKYQTLIGAQIENKNKNRYKNIIPFDRTRVKLIDGPNVPASNDYINANYIVGKDSSCGKKYIATQGPMKKTINDFWRMISQENVHIIVMTTKEFEDGKNKCCRYWPTIDNENVDCEVHNGVLRISFINEETYSDYVLRIFELVHWIESENEEDDELSQFGEARRIFHFQYIAWPDHGVPKMTTGILDFVLDINQYHQKFDGQLVVHCSAGIGRTGTIIVIDMLINEINSKGKKSSIDVFEMVKFVRQQRSGMVQTEIQYLFIYQAIRHYVENIWLDDDNVYSNTSFQECENVPSI